MPNKVTDSLVLKRKMKTQLAGDATIYYAVVKEVME